MVVGVGGYGEEMGRARVQESEQVSVTEKYPAGKSEEGRSWQEGEWKAEQDTEASVASGSEADGVAPPDVSSPHPT